MPKPYVPFVRQIRGAYGDRVENRCDGADAGKSLVRDVVVVPQLPDDVVLPVSTNPAVVDLAVGADIEVIDLGPDAADRNFLIRETSPRD